ncbi:BREX-1 system adenine-specific DNA-methyltransferase PglX [Secundilactobacillus angelensis]|uniref:BREX-1 system adenine-specific DNA-methyltransferase PglX n=1 Tax=Secundilactobacillus angelensis TaxID=2722706 RepID=UPI002FCD78F1
MDKRVINKFAVQARRDLILSVTLRLQTLGITENGAVEKNDRSTAQAEYYNDNTTPLEGADIARRAKIVQRLQETAQNSDWKSAYQDLIEEVAYTWFNRIIAIRFMEVNDYLPSGVRVLSSVEGRNEPDIMFYANDIEADIGTYTKAEHELIQRATDQQLPADLDRMYQMLFIKQANALNANLPKLFERTDDYMQLLFTPSYNRGVIADLVEQIPEADFDISSDDSQGQVEIIGWLYQYYNQEPHNEVVNINGGPVKERDIPAATQLFTTDWVVRYMVDNSLGRYYLEHTPDSKLATHLKYLLPGDLNMSSETLDLTKLRILDNAMGSGHILVYAFDVLMKVYEEQGYSLREAAQLIATQNLYGLEIDKRAYQLAYFAIMMKVRQYDRRALTRQLNLNLLVFENTQNLTDNFFSQLELSVEQRSQLLELRDDFLHAKTLGSIIHFERQYDVQSLLRTINGLNENTQHNLFITSADLAQLQQMVQIVGVLQAKYDVVVTNPPYLNKMDKSLKNYVKKYYKNYSGDLFSIFIWININMTRPDGYAAYMTPFVWMFIKTYEKLRLNILDNQSISSLIQMEYSAFEEATVPINTFVLKNSNKEINHIGTYLKLSAFKGGMDIQKDKVLEAVLNPTVKYLYRTNQANFGKIPGSPIAYWASLALLKDFTIGKPLNKFVDVKHGMTTTDNNRFIRQWYEIVFQNIQFHEKTVTEAAQSNKKWFPFNKGGAFRRWSGNYDYVVNYQYDGLEIKANALKRYPYLKTPDFVVPNSRYYFHPCVTWSDIGSGLFSMRFREQGSIMGNKGPSAYSKDKSALLTVLGLMNSVVGQHIIRMINPTITRNVQDVGKTPVIIFDNRKILRRIQENIFITQGEWNSFETSWEFLQNILIKHIAEHNQNWTIEAAYNQWEQEALNRFNQLKANEEELNRFFIDLSVFKMS